MLYKFFSITCSIAVCKGTDYLRHMQVFIDKNDIIDKIVHIESIDHVVHVDNIDRIVHPYHINSIAHS